MTANFDPEVLQWPGGGFIASLLWLYVTHGSLGRSTADSTTKPRIALAGVRRAHGNLHQVSARRRTAGADGGSLHRWHTQFVPLLVRNGRFVHDCTQLISLGIRSEVWKVGV